MSRTHKRARGDRVERILRSLLGVALATAVAWAWVNTGPAPATGPVRAFTP